MLIVIILHVTTNGRIVAKAACLIIDSVNLEEIASQLIKTSTFHE